MLSCENSFSVFARATLVPSYVREMYLDGLNMVQTYVYWNLHEPRQGQEYDFAGNKNWTLFVEEAAKAGLFVNLRIGPFVASEWDYGKFS